MEGVLPGEVQDTVRLRLMDDLRGDVVVGRDAEGGARNARLNKENIPSRAYIAFKDEETLAAFSREYDGHVFRDKAGKCQVSHCGGMS